MKKVLSFLFVLVLSVRSTAQNTCGILQAYEYVYHQDPLARQRVEELINTPGNESIAQARINSVPTYTVPVVFHILHMGGSENISDAQIMDQIAIMNLDYTRQNSDTANAVVQFQGLVANASTVFRLATKDPDGNCTNGITRHYDPNTNWTVDFNNYIYTWDRTKYLNIYVVKTMPGGTAAYSFYPGTVPALADAIVVRNDYVGSIGTGQPYLSRIITHEAGHWMNLQHPWGGTNQPGVACGDDGVSDTPITKGFTFCDLLNAIDCTAGVTENVQNYMEYAYCSMMFTPGQVSRMHTALNSNIASRDNVWSASNLIATGVVNPVSNCGPKAAFVPMASLSCAGGDLGFLDESYNGVPTTWQWSSTLASGVSGLQNGVLTFTGSGVAPVKLKVSNVFGSDSIVQDILVLAGQGSGSINVTQGFETGTLPDSKWLTTTPQFGSGFERTDTAQYDGMYSAWINNFYDNPNEPVSLFSPAFNLQFATSSQLSFYYAYSQKVYTDNDQLKVSASRDCGQNWTSLFTKSGSLLSTAGAPSSAPYLNPSSQWQEVTIDALSFCGQPEVYFKFEFTPDTAGPGNNLFIDDINLDATIVINVGIETQTLQSLKVSPNPFSSEIAISGEGIQHVGALGLSDISGRTIIKQQKPLVQNNILKLEGLDNLSKGVYFIRIDSPEGTRLLKVIKD